MNDENFFPARPETRPMIYAYEEDNPKYAGMLKVGFASTGVEKRVAEQFPVLKPGDKKPYRIVFAESEAGRQEAVPDCLRRKRDVFGRRFVHG